MLVATPAVLVVMPRTCRVITFFISMVKGTPFMSTVQRTPAEKRYRRDRATSTVAAAGAMMTASTTVAMSFLVVPGAAHFGVSTAQFLLYFSLFILTSAVMFSFAGRIINRYGVKLVLTLGGAISALAWVGMAFSPNIYVFYVIAIVMGIGASGNNLLPANTLVTGWHVHKRRGTVLGIVATGSPFGGMLIGLIFPSIITAGGFVAGSLGIAAMITICSVLPGIFLAKNPPRSGENAEESLETATKADRKAAIKGFGGVALRLAIGSFLFSLEGAFPSVQAAVYASFGIDLATAGMMVAFYSLCGIVAKPLLGFMHDKLGIKALFVILVIMYVFGLPALALSLQLGINAIIPLLAISALSLSVPTVIIPLVAVNSVGKERFPVIYGFMLSGMFAGLALGVPAWGVAFDLAGADAAPTAGGALAGLFGLLLVWIGMRRGLRRRAAINEPITAGIALPDEESDADAELASIK